MGRDSERIYGIINGLAEICVSHGVKYAVLSPGSRSAPLALSFIRFRQIKHFVINDERSAAYVALGIAQKTGNPVVLACTSGTAALNYAPAVAEAYFQRIPLLVLTADRPEEWIAQNENQTIFQKNIYEPNILRSYHISILYEDIQAEKYAYRVLNEALMLCRNPVAGPVHINVPLREPLYLSTGEQPEKRDVHIISQAAVVRSIHEAEMEGIVEKVLLAEKVLIAPGLSAPNSDLSRQINTFLEKYPAVVFHDITANLKTHKNFIRHTEQIISKATLDVKKDMIPEILITFHGQIVSKAVRQFFRDNKPVEHWHIDPSDKVIDTFGCLAKHFQMTATEFFLSLIQKMKKNENPVSDEYLRHLKELDKNARQSLHTGMEKDPELKAMKIILEQLPSHSVLQLGNSLCVRNANMIGLEDNSVEVYSNRGTSGIDGSLSTAVGSALATDKLVVCILGDLSFIYDSNALWNLRLPANLRIIVMNNRGSGIFRKMEGPAVQPELEEYFSTPHKTDLKKLTEAFSVNYSLAEDIAELPQKLSALFSASHCQLLEIKLY